MAGKKKAAPSLVSETDRQRLARAGTEDERVTIAEQIGCDVGARVMWRVLVSLGVLDVSRMPPAPELGWWQAHVAMKAWNELTSERINADLHNESLGLFATGTAVSTAEVDDAHLDLVCRRIVASMGRTPR